MPMLGSKPHSFVSLPDHPDLTTTNTKNGTSSSPSLPEFLHQTLSEAHSFLTAIPNTFHPHRKPRASPPSAAPVQLSTWTDPQTRDFWVCRNTTHEDAAVRGSASWDEFRSGLRDNHAENEMDYTPSVTAVERLLEWPSQPEIEGGWKCVDMHVNIITHTFRPSFLIAPRSFVILAISADLPDTSSTPGFVTVQVPLDGTSKESSIPVTLRQKITASTPSKAVFASYASVERVTSDPDGIHWSMATTSNAAGAIPQWVLRSWTLGGVPKAAVADVGLFLDWTARRRSQSVH